MSDTTPHEESSGPPPSTTVEPGEAGPGGAHKLSVPGLRTLAIDIGGTGIKALVLDEEGQPLTERKRSETPHPATPDKVLHVIKGLMDELAAAGPIDRVSAGFPGVVVEGVTRTAPNLDPSWSGFDLAGSLSNMTGRPARVINDAGMQGHGIIQGHGVEMAITLGTGMGCALFVDGRYVPNIELAHHPFRKGMTYEEYIGNAARKRVGDKKWNRRVRRVIEVILCIFNPQVLYVGGGNSRKLSIELPPGVKVTDNIAGLLGGIGLWRS